MDPREQERLEAERRHVIESIIEAEKPAHTSYRLELVRLIEGSVHDHTQDLLRSYPVRRIKPVDGMAVTAQVWEEAHEFHRQQQRYHALLSHGQGILAGLEVIASQPPSSVVYVLPGIAIGPEGDVILLNEPTPFDLGATAEGLLCLFLTYNESRPMAMGSSDQGDQPLFIRTEFGLEAAQRLPASGGLELARVRRSRARRPWPMPSTPRTLEPMPSICASVANYRWHPSQWPASPLATSAAATANTAWAQITWPVSPIRAVICASASMTGCRWMAICLRIRWFAWLAWAHST